MTFITVDTKFDPDSGIVTQDTTDILGVITRQVLYTKDAQVQAALLKLGWTPPAATPIETVQQARDSIHAAYPSYSHSVLVHVNAALGHLDAALQYAKGEKRDPYKTEEPCK